jgi:D-alanyl-D-alanine carboxypeptidase
VKDKIVRKSLIVGLVALWSAVFLFFLPGVVEAKTLSPSVEANLKQVLSNYMAKYKSPGAYLGIWVAGETPYEVSLGVGDLGQKLPITAKDEFRIGSITKMYVATIVLQMVEEGRLKLEDKLDKFFPEIPNAKNITVRQLLNMTSGIYNYTELRRINGKGIHARYSKWEPDELIAAGVTHKPYFSPGTGIHYSNTNYIILGRIIENLRCNMLSTEIGMRIVNKLKLHNTGLAYNQFIYGDKVRGYMYENGKPVDWMEQDVSLSWAAGAIVSTVNELKLFIEAVGQGKLLGEKLQKERMSDWVDYASKTFPGLQYGLGLVKWNGFIGHHGSLPGYLSMAMYHPEKRVTIIFLLNTEPADPNAALKMFCDIVKTIWPPKK